MVIIHTLLGVDVLCKVHIQLDVASDSTDGGIICMYKAVNKTEAIRVYMESLALNTGVPTVHWEVNTSCISFVKAKIFTPRVNTLTFLSFFYKKLLTMLFFPKI